MNKLANIMLQRLGFSTAYLNQKSQNVIKTFTDTIEDIEAVNERIDKEIEEATNIVSEVEKQRNKLSDMKQANIKIKEKIEKIIS